LEGKASVFSFDPCLPIIFAASNEAVRSSDDREKQRTFVHFAPVLGQYPRQGGKSFFASFCSQKEESFLGFPRC
jgi:hypothetical protein